MSRFWKPRWNAILEDAGPAARDIIPPTERECFLTEETLRLAFRDVLDFHGKEHGEEVAQTLLRAEMNRRFPQ